jgi:hypothetical protein
MIQNETDMEKLLKLKDQKHIFNPIKYIYMPTTRVNRLRTFFYGNMLWLKEKTSYRLTKYK